MFFTESWLSSNISDAMISIDGYTLIRSDRSYSQGGGVVLFYKNGLKIKLIDVDYCSFGLELNNFEFLCIDYFEDNSSIRFLCVYLPPRFALCTVTVQTLCKLVDKVSNSMVPCYIIGDFNLPKIDWKFNTSTGGLSHNIFLQFCVNNGWNQLISTSTHVKQNILDLLLCNYLGKKHLQSFSVNSPLTTKCDHNTISLKFLNETPNTSSSTFNLPDFRRADF